MEDSAQPHRADADLLRVLAIGGVVYGHRLLVSVTCRNGQVSGVDALDYVHLGTVGHLGIPGDAGVLLRGRVRQSLVLGCITRRGRPGPGRSATGSRCLLRPTAVYVAAAVSRLAQPGRRF